MENPSGSDDAEAARVASAASHLLRQLRDQIGFSDPGLLRAEGDRRSHDLIVAELASVRPGDAVLSEEGVDDGSRTGRSRVWIVDPLDGTREFGEPGRSDFAVHVALVVDGRPAAGAVALPASGLLFCTEDPPAPARRRPPVRMAVSRTRATERVLDLARALEAEVLPMGSAGAKTAAVLTGEADLYVHSGGLYEWDAAAPVAVATSAGLHASRLDGSPLEFNRVDPWIPDLLVCRSDLAPAVLERLGAR